MKMYPPDLERFRATSGMTALGVGRKAVAAALARLEQVGLVTVERHRGRAPRVTILDSASSH